MSYIGNTSTQQAFTPAIDYFSGNGSTVAFTLSRPVASAAQVQVTVNNVAQNPSDAFTVLNNTITFTGAPSSGANNIYVQYTSPITQIMQPGQGTVGTLQIADNAITTAKIAAGAVTPSDLSTGAPSWDTSGNLQFNSGYGSVATAYGCRAWVNFNGTGTVAIRASGNVSSITDNGTGDYTVNFTTAMPDANYYVGGISGTPGASHGVIGAPITSAANQQTSSIRIVALSLPGAARDDSFINVAIFR